MCSGLRVLGLWPPRSVAPRRRPTDVLRVREPYLGDRGDDLRPHANAVDGLVQRLLAVRQRQGRDFGAEPETDVGNRFLSDGVAMLHRFRAVLVRPGRERLAGMVQVDETYIGGVEPDLSGGRAQGKKVLTGVEVEVREPKGLGQCRMAPLADASAASLHQFVTDHVEPGATVVTDGWQGYRESTSSGSVLAGRRRRTGIPPCIISNRRPRLKVNRSTVQVSCA